MNHLKGMRVAIVGAGAFGLAAAALAAQEGADVVVYDDQPLGDNASGVAAGMLAPAFEALDDERDGRLALYRRARDLWPNFLEQIEAPPLLLDRSGALRVFGPDEASDGSGLTHSLAAAGATTENLTAAEVRRLQPLLKPTIVSAVYTSEDWRLDALATMNAIQAWLLRRGGNRVDVRVEPGRSTAEVDGQTLGADAVVIAAGVASAAWTALAPELAVLSPIKGQIVHYKQAPPFGGPIVRTRRGYVVPQARGVVAGATMEFGRADTEVDPSTVASLAARAAQGFPHLGAAAWRGRAGVRAATPDGLPLVGASGSGLWLATGARRNGWLLAPMVARLVVAQLQGQAPGEASVFDPARFTPPRDAARRSTAQKAQP